MTSTTKLTAKNVKFNELIHISEFTKEKDYNEDADTGNDTDYEEENIDPVEILTKLLKKKSFGTEEFGQDYESNNELRRQVESTFNSLNNGFKNINKFYIPDFNPELGNDPFIKAELNDIPKILGKEKEKDLKPCEKCSEIMQVNYNPCQVCYRETVDVRCINCFPNILEVCSDKCREIYEGGVSVIEITNDNDETIIIIEDDDQNMVLRVINHKLFYQELNEKDSLMINKPCMNCNEDNMEGNREENDNNSNNDEKDEEEDDDTKNKIGVVPIKCYNCKGNYSYLVVCPICYQKSGIKYLCDDCESFF